MRDARLPVLVLACLLGLSAAAGDSVPVPNAPGEAAGSASGATTRDPVGYVDGTVFDTSVDLRVACPDLDLVFRRHYDSQSCDASPGGASAPTRPQGRSVSATRRGTAWSRRSCTRTASRRRTNMI